MGRSFWRAILLERVRVQPDGPVFFFGAPLEQRYQTAVAGAVNPHLREGRLAPFVKPLPVERLVISTWGRADLRNGFAPQRVKVKHRRVANGVQVGECREVGFEFVKGQELFELLDGVRHEHKRFHHVVQPAVDDTDGGGHRVWRDAVRGHGQEDDRLRRKGLQHVGLAGFFGGKLQLALRVHAAFGVEDVVDGHRVHKVDLGDGPAHAAPLVRIVLLLGVVRLFRIKLVAHWFLHLQRSTSLVIDLDTKNHVLERVHRSRFEKVAHNVPRQRVCLGVPRCLVHCGVLQCGDFGRFLHYRRQTCCLVDGGGGRVCVGDPTPLRRSDFKGPVDGRVGANFLALLVLDQRVRSHKLLALVCVLLHGCARVAVQHLSHALFFAGGKGAPFGPVDVFTEAAVHCWAFQSDHVLGRNVKEVAAKRSEAFGSLQGLNAKVLHSLELFASVGASLFHDFFLLSGTHSFAWHERVRARVQMCVSFCVPATLAHLANRQD